MRRWSVLVVGIVLLAGCQSVIGAFDGSTETPLTPEGGEADPVPGVTVSGEIDSAMLADAHTASLDNRSYTLRTVIVMNQTESAARREIVRTLRVGAEHDRYVFEQRANGSLLGSNRTDVPTINVWTDSNRTIEMVNRGTKTRYTISPSQSPRRRLLMGEEAITVYLSGINQSRVRQVQYGGWVAYQIAATDPDSMPDLHTDVSIVAIVDSFGLLLEFRLVAPARQFLPITQLFSLPWDWVTVTVEYSAVGETTVDQPVWVDSAVNESMVSDRAVS